MNDYSVQLSRAAGESRTAGVLGHLGRLRYQLLLGFLTAVVVPTLLYHAAAPATFFQPSSQHTAQLSSAAFLISLYLHRRVISFPGSGLFAYILPAASAGYGLVLAFIFASRIEYTRLYFALSFAATILFLFGISAARRRYPLQTFYVVPSGAAAALFEIPHVHWAILSQPQLPADRNAVLIADLRADLDPEWERLIAEAALAGIPIYHLKQVQESLTGRVEIEHLSENSFGSLIPNHSYRSVKRLADFVGSVCLLPFIVLLTLVLAALIKIDSSGPVFYTQLRRGYRGQIFRVYKFRTMEHRMAPSEDEERRSAITLHQDPRVTRLGRFLRRTRIDELPQIINVLKGEMSWIGPRPEVVTLSEWYMAELPFYSYRHIVRPGITGWAQVNQGHVADLDSVHSKLHYDFFYIKNFSAWLDILIVLRTMATVFSGFGAR